MHFNESKFIDQPQKKDIYSILGESIKRKRNEMCNLLEINSHQYKNSPYTMRKLRAKPKVIYPKNVIDHAFLFVEGGRNVENYDCSHTFMYGNHISKEDQLSSIDKSGVTTNPTLIL